MPRLHLPTLCAVGGICFTAAALARGGEDFNPELGAAPTERNVPLMLGGATGQVAAYERGQRIRRIYGAAFSHGDDAAASAVAFLSAHAGLFHAERADLVPEQRPDGGNEQGVMYDRETGTYRFTAVYFTQQRDGLPVYRSRVVMLVRNEPGYPLVLVNPDVRDLGDFRVAAAVMGDEEPVDVDALHEQAVFARFGAGAVIDSTRRVIFAGVDDESVAPRLADELTIHQDVDRWRLVVDAANGAILDEEHLIHFIDLNGSVTGLATEGEASDVCANEVSTPLAYLNVTAPLQGVSAVSDENGNFTLSLFLEGGTTVEASLDGVWFDVFDFFNNEEVVSSFGTPPGPVDLVFNESNVESTRAQVNGYVGANVVRDYALVYNPDYPTLQNPDFEVTVNRTDGFCPNNAWYDSSGPSLNFCQSASGPNTAWSGVIYHEYGHHLVEAAGSGQGAYGEGSGDVMAVLVLDSHVLALGWGGNCSTGLRDADNNCQYQSPGCSTCGSEVHDCGQLLAGCVWSTRTELLATNPSTYRDIISALAINAMLLHTGSTINSGITIDYLTLDDDNGNIFDGTPHYTEIAAGFGAHNMGAPELALLAFSFPNGLPELIPPSGNLTIQVQVTGVTGTPEPDTGLMIFNSDGADGTQSIPMTQLEPNLYEVSFPATVCGSQPSFYFSADTTTGGTQVYPPAAPTDQVHVISAVDTTLAFDDDFESDLGWTVSGTVSSGDWDRGVPVGGGDRGDPPTDADGSGQCYLTENVDGDSDVDNGTTILTSPVLDASDPTSYISYWRWYSNVEGGSPEQDTFVVQVSDDGGGSWSVLETVGPSGPEVFGGWYHKSFAIADVATPGPNFRIRFEASDLNPQSLVEAGVDGVEIVTFGCDEGTPCPADLDGTGDVGFSDLLGLLGVWGPCASCPEDLDGSGDVGFSDILVLLGVWGPCP